MMESRTYERRFLLHFLNLFLHLYGRVKDENAPTIIYIILSQLCYELFDSGIF